ncbi:MAG: CHAT domain-containing protein [Acidobacteria bacterium]|nr:CHAT domain-containing protein [Acidobacteriota bacterium]
MSEAFINEKTVREYLLGRVSDETMLEGIEELLFTDEDFCSQVALTEDDLINDYVLGRLNEPDAQSFQATLSNNPERSFKLELTRAVMEKALAQSEQASEDLKAPQDLKASKKLKAKPSFFTSFIALFRQPKYVAVFALLLIAVLVSVVYFINRRSKPDALAELRGIYKQGRPTETRISEFDYAPLAELRGAAVESKEQSRLRLIELRLIENREKTPNAQTFHALGVFHLTQGKFADAIKEFESALKFDDKSARIHNDLGAAHFELAKTVPQEKRLEELAQSFEEFTRATELDGNLLEALFNKSLALQEMKNVPGRAKESWKLYLQKDSSSPWAEEARRNLSRLEGAQSLFKKNEEVLEDFLNALRLQDDARAQKIHDETKGMLNDTCVPLQLSQRYLLAKKRGDEAQAQESLAGMAFIGSYERERRDDFFFSELASFYAHAGAEKFERLLQAKEILTRWHHPADGDFAKAISQFEKSRDIFASLGDKAEADIAEVWAVQYLPDVSSVSEGQQRAEAMIADASGRKFKVLLPTAYYWLGDCYYKQSRFSQMTRNYKEALRLAEAGGNAFEIQHVQEALASYYANLGELEPALAYASQMLPGRELYYQNASQSWREKGTLADLFLNLKLFSTSMSFSTEALEIARKDMPDDGRVNSNLTNVVNAALAKGDLQDALKYADESKQLALSRGEGAENTRTNAEVYLLLAEVKSRMKNCAEALTDYDKALELYARLPEMTVGSYELHKGKLFCFQELGRQEDFSDELKTVLSLSEQYRAAIREDDSRQAFFANEQEVFDAATAHAIKEHDSEGAYAFAEESRARSLLEFVESDKSISELEKEFPTVARSLALSEIRARLPEQLQLVQYAMLPDRLAIWIVSKTRFEFVEKQIAAAELERKIDDYQAFVTGKLAGQETKQAAQELYQLLIPPGLDSSKQLCLIPDKSLHGLAFASLISPGGKYLLEDYALFYAPSASVLALATENAGRKEQVREESLLSIGNPDFDREENPNLADLRSAEDEAKAVAAGYGHKLELFGGEATKEKFLESFTKVEVIHFAGHFVSNRQSPGNSKLLFAGGDLRSKELGAYKLSQAKLVVLSACETAFERYDKSEGAIGAARTFLALGSPVVLASGWQVDSEPTKVLMIAFHRNRKERGMSCADSLRQAQLEMLGRDATALPFYWAAFSLFGGYANY